MKNKTAYIAHTIFIYIMWLFMLYVVFLAFKPTKHLSVLIGMFTFVMGGLAMFAPTQAGIGAWHFMVIQALLMFGINKENCETFALITHSFTNISLAILAIIFIALLPVINRKIKTKEK